ncbi:MAG TPA: hypothetical protein VMT52_00795, partial [Planctomycetota bacterium]|nr:hypothetical protein [Planctomycetota bacterium]
MRAYLRLAALLVLPTSSAPAQEVYARLKLEDVPITEGTFPTIDVSVIRLSGQMPYALVDGGGEA